MRVLVCDDNPMRHEMFVPLTWLGNDVVCASTIAVALGMLDAAAGVGPHEHGHWDIVCLDHDFRGMVDDFDAPEAITGRALARRITELTKAERPALVVVHTANARAGEAMLKILLDAGVTAQRHPLSNIFLR